MVIDYVVDNAGLDIVSDLLLMSLLTHYKIAKLVRIHVKQTPV